MTADNRPCLVCGTEAQVLVATRGRDGALRAVACEACGFVYLDPRPEATRTQYTDGRFSELARGASVPDRKKAIASEVAAARRSERLARAGLDDPHRSEPVALEIGCGIGSFLRILRGRGWEVRGIEPDAAYASFGAERYGVSIAADFYEDVETPAGSVGLISSFHVLEHVDDPGGFLAKAHGDLCEGGLLYLEVPSTGRPYGGDLDLFFWSSHLSYFDETTLARLLEAQGFAIQQIEHDGDFLWCIASKLSGVADGGVEPPPTNRGPQVAARLRASRRRHALRTSKPTQAARRAKHLAGEAVRDPGRAAGKALAMAGLPPKSGLALHHVGIHQAVNAGDATLFPATREALERTTPTKPTWRLDPVWSAVTDKQVAQWNTSDGLVVGGGGLLLSDTEPNQVSGWQWPISVQQLRAIEAPLIVYGVGYNRFPGQPDFPAPFEESVVALVETATFVGLRNSGSVAALRDYLPERLRDRPRLQPCPTVHANRWWPAPEGSEHALTAGTRTLGLNVAFDRPELRFQGRENETLQRLARSARTLADEGWSIRLMVHDPIDITFGAWLRRAGVQFTVVDLAACDPTTVADAYRHVAVTAGMRGHAQMIPFGVGGAIISLVTHQKLRWFLDDIDAPDFSLDLGDASGDNLVDMVRDIDSRRDAVALRLRTAEEQLWRTTLENSDLLRRVWQP